MHFYIHIYVQYISIYSYICLYLYIFIYICAHTCMNTWIHVYACRFSSPVWIFSPALSRNHKEARLGAGVGSPCCLSHQKQLIWWEPQQRCPGGEQQGRELGKQEGNCRKTPLRAKTQSLSCMQQLGYFHTSLWSGALLTHRCLCWTGLCS